MRQTAAQIKALYGQSARITRKNGFALVHLDGDLATRRKRTTEFDPATAFCADCPLCELIKNAGVVVFDDRVGTGWSPTADVLQSGSV